MEVCHESAKLFALRYCDRVEVLEPQTLRDSIRKSLENVLADRYQ